MKTVTAHAKGHENTISLRFLLRLSETLHIELPAQERVHISLSDRKLL